MAIKADLKQKEGSSVKGYIIGTTMVLVLVGFFKSIYQFRIGALKHNIPVRDINDTYYIILASIINLVSPNSLTFR
jgi:hypothetical protein